MVRERLIYKRRHKERQTIVILVISYLHNLLKIVMLRENYYYRLLYNLFIFLLENTIHGINYGFLFLVINARLKVFLTRSD